MPAPDRIIFWEPSCSPHKFEFFSALAQQHPDIPVHCVSHMGQLQERSKLGWTSDKIEGFTLEIAPSDARIDELIDLPGTLHIMSGTRHFSTIVRAIKQALRSGARFCILSEPRVREGWKGILRYFQSITTERALMRNVECVFAIGKYGRRWFSDVGYPNDRIVDFAYFVDPPLEKLPDSPTGALRIGYLGRLNSEKGADIFLALSRSPSLAGCQFFVAGAGPLQSEFSLEGQRRPGLFSYLGVIPRKEIGAFFGALDILIVPSVTTDDGWGVVCSEALMCGVYVCVSDRVGSSTAIIDSRLGTVFDPNLVAKDPRCLFPSASVHAEIRTERALRASWARATLSSTAGALHFWNTVTALELGVPLTTISPPWQLLKP